MTFEYVKYEYKRCTDTEIQGEHLRLLGEQGWKLVHVYPAGHEADGRARPKWYTEYLFMRELPGP